MSTTQQFILKNCAWKQFFFLSHTLKRCIYAFQNNWVINTQYKPKQTNKPTLTDGEAKVPRGAAITAVPSEPGLTQTHAVSLVTDLTLAARGVTVTDWGSGGRLTYLEFLLSASYELYSFPSFVCYSTLLNFIAISRYNSVIWMTVQKKNDLYWLVVSDIIE